MHIVVWALMSTAGPNLLLEYLTAIRANLHLERNQSLSLTVNGAWATRAYVFPEDRLCLGPALCRHLLSELEAVDDPGSITSLQLAVRHPTSSLEYRSIPLLTSDM